LNRAEFWKILSHPDRRFIDLRKAELLLSEGPRSLYKYCPTSVEAITNFAAGQIWLERPLKFNNPLDTVFNSSGFSLFKEPPPVVPAEGPFPDVGKDFDTWQKRWDFPCDWRLSETRDKVLLLGHDTFRERVVVSCFSEVSPSEGVPAFLLWAHYASSHKGFCAEYDLQKMRDGLFPAFPINYVEDFFDIAPLQQRAANQNYLNQFPDAYFNELAPIIIASHKLQPWSYEREWRYILPAAPQSRKVPIVSITTGCDCATDLIHLLKELVNARRIKIYQMVRATRMGSASLLRTDITNVTMDRVRGFK